MKQTKKCFKYQITTKILLNKYKVIENELSPVCFNSTKKTVINHKFDLGKSFQDYFSRIFSIYTELITGLVKDLVGGLNHLIHNTLTFQLIDH